MAELCRAAKPASMANTLFMEQEKLGCCSFPAKQPHFQHGHEQFAEVGEKINIHIYASRLLRHRDLCEIVDYALSYICKHIYIYMQICIYADIDIDIDICLFVKYGGRFIEA